jgi:hypothetical protein
MATRLRPAETVHVGLQHWSRDYDATLPAAASVRPGAEVAVDLGSRLEDSGCSRFTMTKCEPTDT